MVSFRVPNQKSEPQAQLGKLRLHLLEIKFTSQLCQFKYSHVKQTAYLDSHLRCLEKVKKNISNGGLMVIFLGTKKQKHTLNKSTPSGMGNVEILYDNH